MSDDINAGTAAVAPTELKSTDTSIKALMEPKAEAATPAPKVEKVTDVQQEPQGDAGEVTDAPSADSPQGKHDKLPRWVKERMERVRRVTEAETRERVLQEVQNRQPERQEPARVESTNDKTLEDFDFDQGKYTAYLVKQGIAEEKQRERHESEQKKHAEKVETFKAKIDKFEERIGAGAWEEIETSALNTDPAMKPLTDLFMGDDHDLEIAHHLALNPKEAERLLSLSPLGRVRELAKLAEQFDSTPAEKTAPTLPKKLTNAPPPPKTVTGGGKSIVSVDDPNISTEQRIALWQAKRKKS